MTRAPGARGGVRSRIRVGLAAAVALLAPSCGEPPPAWLDFASLDARRGIVFEGSEAHRRLGRHVADAGDVNGDGLADAMVSAPLEGAPGAPAAGRVYVLFGTRGLRAAPPTLAALDGSAGFTLHGALPEEQIGVGLAAAGDLNGDGLGDIVVGAPSSTPAGRLRAGRVYVVFGSRDGFAAAFDLAGLDGSNGFVLLGEAAGDAAGAAVAGAGDLNGDGLGDLVVGAPRADADAGRSYVVFGRRGASSAELDLGALEPGEGFVVTGPAKGRSGRSVAAAGDVNGDGLGDLIVGAGEAGPDGGHAGESYLVFGSRSPFPARLEPTGLDGSNGFVIRGARSADRAGRSVRGAGDVNGDGVDDLLIGAPFADPRGRRSAGAAYVVFGRRGDFPPVFDLGRLDGSNGFAIYGGASQDQAGFSVSGAGDFDGDGMDDVLVGAFGAGPAGQARAGSAYLVYGRRGGFAAALDLADLDGWNGFVLAGGRAGDFLGRSVSKAGDLDGDGLGDVLVAAFGSDPQGRPEAGAAALLFGQRRGRSGGCAGSSSAPNGG